jgi:hypothetical protein
VVNANKKMMSAQGYGGIGKCPIFFSFVEKNDSTKQDFHTSVHQTTSYMTLQALHTAFGW